MPSPDRNVVIATTAIRLQYALGTDPDGVGELNPRAVDIALVRGRVTIEFLANATTVSPNFGHVAST